MTTPNFSTHTCKLAPAEAVIQVSIDIHVFDLEKQLWSASPQNGTEGATHLIESTSPKVKLGTSS